MEIAFRFSRKPACGLMARKPSAPVPANKCLVTSQFGHAYVARKMICAATMASLRPERDPVPSRITRVPCHWHGRTTDPGTELTCQSGSRSVRKQIAGYPSGVHRHSRSEGRNIHRHQNLRLPVHSRQYVPNANVKAVRLPATTSRRFVHGDRGLASPVSFATHHSAIDGESGKT
jgi:hypothetical protein